ncbi:MAG: efflux transporter outer membrane subunit [Burkholderiales bacterium]
MRRAASLRVSLMGISALGIFLAGGCATVGRDHQPPGTKAEAQFANAADPSFDQQEPIAEFWKLFADRELDELIAEALIANHDIRIADARLQEARGVRRDAEGERFPTVTANTGYTLQQFSTAEFPGSRSDRNRDAYFARLEPFWEIDFFGRVRRSIEARVAELGAAEAGLYAAHVAVAGELARTYFELRGLQRSLAVARENARNQRSTVDLVVARQAAGRGIELDTLRAEGQLESTLALVPLFEERVARAIYRISVLTGRQPNALNAQLAPQKSLPQSPVLTSIGTPEQLLRRRPDIRIAERQLAAATARIGVATGDLFPRVIISGRVGFQARTLPNLVETDSVSYSFGPSIQWSAFDFARVRARIGIQESRAAAALAQYEQTVLRALEETEGALVAYARSRQREAGLRRAAASSEGAVRLARLRFEGGVSDFLTVLDAERRQLQDQDQLAQSEMTTATALVAVYKSLGGGWKPIAE